MSTRPDLRDYVENFRRRVAQDALAEATKNYWNGRAKTFEEAMPRPGDFTGAATPVDLETRRQRLADIVRACRERAAVSLLGGAQ